MWDHFPSGCFGFCDLQTIYVQTEHEIHVPLNRYFYIKGSVWKTIGAQWHPHVHTMTVNVTRVRRSQPDAVLP